MSAIPQTMKAAVTHGADEVRIEEIPVPAYEPDQILVKVAACGICGTDTHILAGHMRPAWPPYYPFIQGHEWCGTVAAIGSGARTSLREGDRVIMEPTVGCGVCATCIRGDYHLCEDAGKPGGGYKLLGHTSDGSFSEYGVAPPNNLHKMPDAMGWEDAVIVNQVVIALHALDRGRVEPADRVGIVGPGLLGLAVLQLAKVLGASRTYITGRGYRLDIARELGADVAIDVTQEDPVEAVMRDTGGRGWTSPSSAPGPPRPCGPPWAWSAAAGASSWRESTAARRSPSSPTASCWTRSPSSAGGARPTATPAPSSSWPMATSTRSGCSPTPFRSMTLTKPCVS